MRVRQGGAYGQAGDAGGHGGAGVVMAVIAILRRGGRAHTQATQQGRSRQTGRDDLAHQTLLSFQFTPLDWKNAPDRIRLPRLISSGGSNLGRGQAQPPLVRGRLGACYWRMTVRTAPGRVSTRRIRAVAAPPAVGWATTITNQPPAGRPAKLKRPPASHGALRT